MPKAAKSGFARGVLGQVILDHDDLARILRVLRQQDKRIVFVSGIFDLVTASQVRCLQDATSRGDFLVVAVRSDASARRIHGPQRPFQVAADRLLVVASLLGVDYVTIVDEDSPDDLLRKLRPSAVATGRGDALGPAPEAAAREIGAERLILDGDESRSVDALLRRIHKSCAQESVRRARAAGAPAAKEKGAAKTAGKRGAAGKTGSARKASTATRTPAKKKAATRAKAATRTKAAPKAKAATKANAGPKAKAARRAGTSKASPAGAAKAGRTGRKAVARTTAAAAAAGRRRKVEREREA